MRILLVQPPARDFYDSPGRLFPLGLCYLKAALLHNIPGAEVRVLDARVGFGRRTAPLPPELAFLRSFYSARDTGPFSTFREYYHFGSDYKYVVDYAVSYAPDLFGISSLFSAYHAEAEDLARSLKKRLPAVPIVMGGPHASALPLLALENGAADFVVRGEGERPLVELAKALSDGVSSFDRVPNLVWKKAGAITENPREANYALEDLPPPEISDLTPSNYRLGREPLATLLATRGCPHGCFFCSAGEIFGKRHRRRSAESLLAEIRLRRAQGYRAFDFEDDNLTLGRENFHKLLLAVISEYGEGTLALSAMNGINYQDLDGETLALMRRAGFSQLNVSLASHDEGGCRALGRPSSNAKFAEVVSEAAAQGFLVTGYLILGLPGEPLETALDGLAFLAGLPLLIGVSPFYLAPGMALWEGEATRERLMRARLTALGQNLGECTREDVYTLFVCARIINFLKGLSFPCDEIPLPALLHAVAASGGREKTGAELLDLLLTRGVMHGDDGAGRFELPNFRVGLFLRLFARMGRIRTRDGRAILLA